MTPQETDLASLIDRSGNGRPVVPFEGYSMDDMNNRDHRLLVQSPESIFSIDKADITREERLDGDRVRLWVTAGARALRVSPCVVNPSSPFTAVREYAPPVAPDGSPGAPVREDMENIPPPPSVYVSGAPTPARVATPPLSEVGERYNARCFGGDSYENNCAHFLSDAFIRAGYTELLPPNDHVAARCPAKRPIRARNMWSWFKAKAVRTSRVVEENTGWWAVFQIDGYWGGHVVLLDSDNMKWYGTAWHSDHNQYLYQW
ncbi:hypothetical protein E1292_17610 [Nonomuraea deserti]|uniref:Amidase domain-containing protein n=1 Tax=Nonomuraea deserti TaxID=1848322 RepID=A0A4R4VJV3_9ACTN|nr:hypothetical protein [Nonomuraea deserti]TDD05271.1 hypothetical protein E1292_17610 [Nonomuraea deserti]